MYNVIFYRLILQSGLLMKCVSGLNSLDWALFDKLSEVYTCTSSVNFRQHYHNTVLITVHYYAYSLTDRGVDGTLLLQIDMQLFGK